MRISADTKKCRTPGLALFCFIVAAYSLIVRQLFSSTRESNESTCPVAALTFALCMYGSLRAFVREDMQKQFEDAVIRPLEPAKLDIFIALSETDVSFLAQLERRFHPITIDAEPSSCTGDWCDSKDCIRTGYQQAQRWRVCGTRISQHEAIVNNVYDYVLFARTDLEYHRPIPTLPNWIGLKRDVVLSSMVSFQTSKSHGRVNEIQFMGDFFTILPNLAAQAMWRTAERFEACIPSAPPADQLCGKHWTWAECRPWSSLKGFTVARIEGFIPPSIVRCATPDGAEKSLGCERTFRTNCITADCGSLEERALTLIGGLRFNHSTYFPEEVYDSRSHLCDETLQLF